ncbi:hypothetical protein A3B45_02220 [Candidatus Daviesbacteria bacterium RIFCSPLOWO2_01_FULL_39_12]|uniref:Uncharacterized protein n=1 Tax=Candidatus Daviesbacteria bacterium RIFCSPLOWO2_01_FULL_39_12 TaxID=1797785 RepID=A0A1F5KNC8_9BACT|nr:MAG: hypothetical protein A3D79_00915 [Candidatus Daviesbacteria bacterium RIFCSPHIGHO2_02_FULL_39_8]OGE42344.1 MAG: hypothetical protein A3B45_02220 [Candidatus Daviesbacteria bacterium RIFCSPLOWO2_01_FULL_39_12]
MGENVTGSEFQPLSLNKKEQFIRRKLAQFGTDTSERGWKELNVRLLHPEVLTWETSSTPSKLPPQQGKIIDVSPDISGGKRIRNKFVRVDFTSSTPITGISYAQFGLGAVEITTGGEIVIDCSRLESLHGGIQVIFPQNTFFEKTNVPTLKHK